MRRGMRSPSGRFAFEDRVPPTYDYQLHYFDEVGDMVLLSDDEIRRGEYAWSRDGSWMALAKDIDGNTDIYVVRPDGDGERRLTVDPAEDITPTWSPDGREIAFRRMGTNGGLWTIDVETGSVEQLTDAALSAGPSWSPSEELIVFSAPDPVEPWNSALWGIRSDGSGLTRLAADGGGLGYKELVWSRDGTKLAVTRPAAAGWELVVESRRVRPRRRGGIRTVGNRAHLVPRRHLHRLHQAQWCRLRSLHGERRRERRSDSHARSERHGRDLQRGRHPHPPDVDRRGRDGPRWIRAPPPHGDHRQRSTAEARWVAHLNRSQVPFERRFTRVPTSHRVRDHPAVRPAILRNASARAPGAD